MCCSVVCSGYECVEGFVLSRLSSEWYLCMCVSMGVVGLGLFCMSVRCGVLCMVL